MNRCKSLVSAAAKSGVLALAALTTAVLVQPLPAVAQVPESLGGLRTFPVQARRGTLAVLSTTEAEIDGKLLRMAPGMRLLSPQNSLIMLHTVIGKEYVVNYNIEPSTGMLHTAWILNKEETALPRAGSAPSHNFRFDSDANPG